MAVEAFSLEEQQRLLMGARLALEARVYRLPQPPADVASPLDERRGAFVSIHHGAALRGCLGRLETDWSVGRVVAHLGEAVADADPRFPPVETGELAALHIEVSILTPPREVRDAAEIAVGRHGLIVEQHRRRGLLLPQVAPQHGWDVETFLEQTCKKAGLNADAWRSGARVSVFEAQVFSERSRRLSG